MLMETYTVMDTFMHPDLVTILSIGSGWYKLIIPDKNPKMIKNAVNKIIKLAYLQLGRNMDQYNV